MGSDFDFGSSSRNQSSFHLLLEEIGFAAYYTKIAIPIVFCDTYESFTTSSITEILHAQLLTELKRIFEEISNMLDLLEIFFKCPSEKTAEPLKLLSEYRKCDSIELSTSDERGKLPDALRTLMNRIFQKTDNEYLVENSNSSSEEYNVQFMKQPLSISRSISQESSKLNLEKEKKSIPLQICEPLVNSGVEILCKSSRCRDQKTRLQKQLKLWQIKYEVILLEFGEISVEKSAEERKRKEYALFQQIYRGHFQNRHGNGHGRSSCEIGCLNGFLKSQIENENCDCVKVNTAVSGEKPVRGAEALLTQGNHQSSIKEMFARNKDERRKEEQHNSGVSTYQNNSDATNPEMRGRSCITAEERSSGGEGNNGSGNVNGTIVITSASEEGNLSFSVQQDYSNEREFISLDVVPPPSVATILYTNYKLLLVSQSQVLLSCDVLRLKDWAAQNFSIENAQNATEVFLQLDKKGVINASDLSPLRNFFESIIRYDLVYIIDEFLLGDYTLLHKISVMKKRDSTKALQNPQRASRYTSLLSPLRQTHRRGPARNEAFSGSLQLNTDQNQAGSRKPENSNGAQNSAPHQRNQPLFPNASTLSNTNNPKLPSVIPNRESHSSTQQQTLKSFASGFTQRSVFVNDGPVASDRRTTAGNSSTRRHSSVTSNARNTQAFGNDSSKLSKLQPPEESIGSNWLCSHYKRQCYVKFECCEKFWPCHRCHNNQSTCGQKKLKSRDTQMVKCVHCNKVQPFGQFCCNCATIFASYFCGMCKHLTGNDDHPYHCNKCGICRIHGDRSFHCDVCGVCLDVQLRGNHKCRAGSAHDECCICLEDAFTGCQILPCSHKVHKECATQMIRSGITRCPICRESFAHKLERRPLQNARKRSGK